MTMDPFGKIAIIGLGLIGSSIAHAARRGILAREIVGFDASADVRTRAATLGFCDAVAEDSGSAVADAELVVLCVPVGACGPVAQAIAPYLKTGAILSDVGSVKCAVIRDMAPHVPAGVHFIPAHPIAGTEFSGPEAGFASLFDNRWAILTPLPGADPGAVARLKGFWQGLGSQVDAMDATHHDLVLAITSHLPHLIAYNIVGTAHDLETVTEGEVIKYSAGGFRDFTRIAASDPTMWRDVFLNNKDAVMEVLGRFNEDLAVLQRAIRNGDGDKLYEFFTRTRAIRRAIIDMGQESAAPNFGRDQN
ncbi:MAG: cyclohexadienyl dehydrogenase [Alphaproteobacteria bacterium 64-11]|mgnify:CR=1 FL=1|nr:prephenate/arogenate dehydrogenase family protein [Alphaproteobacteria bacterium]OJU13295.1 MAG: cyclohexadienyl dehydrogenase [Alphaproteobacteria bacterium 64-11]